MPWSHGPGLRKKCEKYRALLGREKKLFGAKGLAKPNLKR